MLIQCGCQNVISIVTLFGVRITAQDKHFQDVNRRAALQWGASSATFPPNAVKMSQTKVSRWGQCSARRAAFSVGVFTSSDTVHLRRSLSKCFPCWTAFESCGMHLNNTRGSVYSAEGPAIKPHSVPEEALSAQPRAPWTFHSSLFVPSK